MSNDTASTNFGGGSTHLVIGCIYGAVSVQKLTLTHFITHNTLPSYTSYDPRVTPDAWRSLPQVVKEVSILIHSPLPSIHIYHVQ